MGASSCRLIPTRSLITFVWNGTDWASWMGIRICTCGSRFRSSGSKILKRIYYHLRQLMETGEWEPATWDAMAAHLPSGNTFIDVGAHLGYCSLMAATLVGSERRVVAIEANPEMVQHLSRNIHASKVTVNIQPVSCFDSETFVGLFAGSHANSESSISQVNASLAEASQRSCRVQARPLDAILNSLGDHQYRSMMRECLLGAPKYL